MKKSDFSKLLISEALLILMKNKEFSKINVTDITEKAGVSRLTFYRNFETKQDVLRWNISRGIAEFMSNIDAKNIHSLREVIVCCFSFWYERKDEIQCIVEHNLSYILQEPFEYCMKCIFEKIKINANYTATQKSFILGGLFANMLVYISSSTPISGEMIADEILYLFREDFDISTKV